VKDYVPYLILAGSAAVAVIRTRARLRNRRNQIAKATTSETISETTNETTSETPKTARTPRAWLDSDFVTASPRAHELGLVAGRELRERLRGRLFRVGTALMLVAVAAAIVIPTLYKNHATPQKVGVVSTLTPAARSATAVAAAVDAAAAGTTATLIPEPETAAAQDALRSGKLTVAIVDGPDLLVDKAPDPRSTSAGAEFVRSLALTLGEDVSFQAAGLTPQQSAQVASTRPLPISSLRPAATKPSGVISVAGIMLIFLMLSQYNTWTLMGVMEEKSSRVA
jgi:ABC-2 type transport system permease protein